MKLSTAIRLGAMLKPQGFGKYLEDEATCALGAALDARGVFGTHFRESELFPIILILSPGCPICDERSYGGDVGSTIFHLNDDHLWTRERIADWVETVEAAQDTTLAEPVKVLTHVQG